MGCTLTEIIDSSEYTDEHGNIHKKDNHHCGKNGMDDCIERKESGVKEFFCSKDADYECRPLKCIEGWEMDETKKKYEQICNINEYKMTSANEKKTMIIVVKEIKQRNNSRMKSAWKKERI